MHCTGVCCIVLYCNELGKKTVDNLSNYKAHNQCSPAQTFVFFVLAAGLVKYVKCKVEQEILKN